MVPRLSWLCLVPVVLSFSEAASSSGFWESLAHQFERAESYWVNRHRLLLNGATVEEEDSAMFEDEKMIQNARTTFE